MSNRNNRSHSLIGAWPFLVALVLDLLFTLWAWPRLPGQIPIHWSAGGVPDSFAPRWAGAFLPLLGAGLLYLYFRASAAERLKGYPPAMARLYIMGIPTLLLAVHAGTLIYAMR